MKLPSAVRDRSHVQLQVQLFNREVRHVCTDMMTRKATTVHLLQGCGDAALGPTHSPAVHGSISPLAASRKSKQSFRIFCAVFAWLCCKHLCCKTCRRESYAPVTQAVCDCECYIRPENTATISLSIADPSQHKFSIPSQSAELVQT